MEIWLSLEVKAGAFPVALFEWWLFSFPPPYVAPYLEWSALYNHVLPLFSLPPSQMPLIVLFDNLPFINHLPSFQSFVFIC